MITLQVGKKEVQLPEKLSIRQYKELKKIEDFDKNPIEFISAISGLDIDDIRYSKKKDMDFVFKFLTQNYLTKPDKTLRTTFTLDDVEYGLMSDMSSLNFGGWVDLEYLTTEGVEKNIEKIMSVMYRPIIKEDTNGFVLEEYDHDKMKERSELFLDLPIDYFWGVSNFFFNLVKAYTENMRVSLEFQKTKRKALARLRMMNPLYHLSKLYHVFTGLALCRYVKKTLQRLTK